MSMNILESQERLWAISSTPYCDFSAPRYGKASCLLKAVCLPKYSTHYRSVGEKGTPILNAIRGKLSTAIDIPSTNSSCETKLSWLKNIVPRCHLLKI